MPLDDASTAESAQNLSVEIATGGANLGIANNRTAPWRAIINKIRQPVRSKRTRAEYDQLDKDGKNKEKNVGWVTGGYCEGGIRNATSVKRRQLVTIDLDRCTRCDECVRACVATHTDGRTRLFLDGPRFGKYLVPTACRSCSTTIS